MTKLYQPSNGTEGYSFIDHWCENCHNNKPDADDGGCTILLSTMIYSVGDEDYPREWCYDDKGRPQCTAFEQISESATFKETQVELEKLGQVKLLEVTR